MKSLLSISQLINAQTPKSGYSSSLNLCHMLISSKAVVTIWAIWFFRRKAVHESIFQSPLSTFHFIQHYLEDPEIAKLAQRKVAHGETRNTARTLIWLAPPSGYFKISVDWAVSRGESIGSAAAVCRDQNGLFQGASSIATPDPATIEAIEALSLASDLSTLLQTAWRSSMLLEMAVKANIVQLFVKFTPEGGFLNLQVLCMRDDLATLMHIV
jgi:hypothetical protein